MMEAQVTVKMSPAELELLCSALEARADQLAAIHKDGAIGPEMRRHARETAARIALVLEKLR